MGLYTSLCHTPLQLSRSMKMLILMLYVTYSMVYLKSFQIKDINIKKEIQQGILNHHSWAFLKLLQ